MTSVVAVVSQWSDEAQGKIIDWLSERSDVTMALAHGSDAGYVLVVDGENYKLSLLRSHLVAPSKLALISQGIAVSSDVLITGRKEETPGRLAREEQGTVGDPPGARRIACKPSATADPLLSHHKALCKSLLRLICRL